jgi:hypothetical protein
MIYRILSLAAVAALLSGCTSYSAPTLDVVNVSLGDQTPQGMVIKFTLDADNENSEPLPLESVRYTLYLNDEAVFSGYRSPESTLRRFGTQQITLPAVVELGGENARPTGRATYRLEGTLEYVTPGEIAKILYDAEIQRPTVGFSKEGVIELGGV